MALLLANNVCRLPEEWLTCWPIARRVAHLLADCQKSGSLVSRLPEVWLTCWPIARSVAHLLADCQKSGSLVGRLPAAELSGH